MKTSTPLAFQPLSPNEDVGTALNLLQEALADEERRLRTEGAQAMQNGNYDTATSVIDFAKRLLAFTGKVESLGAEWQALETFRDDATPEVQQIVSKRFFGRISKGEITPQLAFERPVLEVLVEMGGGGKTKTVLNRVGEKMKDVLKPIDYERHKSIGNQIRWRNTAQWARNEMANKDGRMKNDSRSGYWEISDKGRAWLRESTSRTSPRKSNTKPAVLEQTRLAFPVSTAAADNSRNIKDLNRSAPHTLTEDFTFKRPCGFVLDGKDYQNVSTWNQMYELTLRQLAKKDPALFKSLPDNPATITRRGNHHFSTNPADMRNALALPNGIHTETNLSANHLCDSIRTVLGIFSIPLTSCTIFLRQDRDA